MFTKLHVSHSAECPCGISSVMAEHLLQNCPTHQNLRAETWGRYHRGRRPSSDDSLHESNSHSTIGTRQTEYHEALPSSANVQSPHTSSMVALHDTRFVECRWYLYLTQSQYTDTGPTSPGADPITPGAWQGSHWSANFCHWYDSTPKKS